VQVLEDHHLPIRDFMCVGGGTKTAEWLRIIADVTGHTVRTAQVTAGACYGDALMAGIGVGHFAGFGALRDKIKVARTFQPDPATHQKYKQYQQLYNDLYPATRDLMHRL
jgi:xylulokinase